MAWLEQAPLWIIWPALSLSLLAAMVGGFLTDRLVKRDPSKPSENQSFLLSAALALLGLLIAFTFSMAAGRFDTRRSALLQEANAVGTTYLRFQTLDEPYRGTLTRDLLSYLDARQAFFAAGGNPSAIDHADAATGQVEAGIWTTLADWVRGHPAATANVSLMQATNDMFDLAATDRVVREARVPLTIIRSLAIYALIAAFLLGQNFGSRKDRRPFAAAIVFVLVSLSIALILDLDRPASGTITVSAVPFERAVASIKAMEAEKQAQTPR